MTTQPTTTETRSLEGEATVVTITRDYGNSYSNSYQIELQDGTRSKTYYNFANALKAWNKAWKTGKVVK